MISLDKHNSDWIYHYIFTITYFFFDFRINENILGVSELWLPRLGAQLPAGSLSCLQLLMTELLFYVLICSENIGGRDYYGGSHVFFFLLHPLGLLLGKLLWVDAENPGPVTGGLRRHFF